jgi:hypothetical protein
MEQPCCEACGSTDGAVPRPVPLRTVACDTCWEQADAGFPGREPEPPDYGLALDQIRAGVADDDNQTACNGCGAPAAWHRTVRGRWVMMEPGEYPTAQVPAGKRWRIAGDGTAINLGRANPSDYCRVSHFDVCPANPAPGDSKVLLAVWRQHSRQRRPAWRFPQEALGREWCPALSPGKGGRVA